MNVNAPNEPAGSREARALLSALLVMLGLFLLGWFVWALRSGHFARPSYNSCINNLRQLEGAKEQWALEHKKAPADAVTLQDLEPYLKGNTIPACQHQQPKFYEHQGTYAVTTVGASPTCSCPGHTLEPVSSKDARPAD